MNKDHITELLPEYLDGVLDTSQIKRVESHLTNCATCTKELKALKKLFHAFQHEKTITPPETIRTNFYEQLELEKQANAKVISLDSKPMSSKKQWASNLFKIAASIALLLASFMLGKLQEEQKGETEIAALKNKTLEVKQTAMLSLIENQSASRRIQGVHYINEFVNPDEAIIKALADRMLYDENTNVRLTAVEALRKFANSEAVKEAFITALQTEKDPSIQITLIHTLVEIQEKKAIQPMRRLLEQQETQPFVKQQIESLLPKII